MTYASLKKQHLLLNCRSGSHAYGLALPTSDEDLRGVFLLPRHEFYGPFYTPQLADATNDRTYYELGRFLELLGKANPTALELLATEGEDVLYRHPALKILRVEDFLTKACRDTFAGYAASQIRKAKGLNKKVYNPVDQERKGVEHFCYVIEKGRSLPLLEWLKREEIDQRQVGLASINHARDLYAAYHDPEGDWAAGITRGTESNSVALSNVPKQAPLLAYLSFNKDGYSTYCRDYREYWGWVADRNDERYAGTLAHGQGYDAKNTMHTIRLLEMATEIFTEGELRVRRPNRDFLLSIRAGKYSLVEVLKLAEERLEILHAAADRSDLPEQVAPELIGRKLVKLREDLYT